MATKQYSLSQYNEILFGNMEYRLPENITKIVEKLSSLLGVSNELPDSSRTKQCDPHREKDFKNKRYGYNKEKDVEWETLRSFKSTVIEKKEGVEKTISDIRNCLNKISIKNYDTNKAQIISLIDEVIEKQERDKLKTEQVKSDKLKTEENELLIGKVQESTQYKDLEKIAINLFDIASTNKFFSEIYAKLYGELVVKYSIFNSILSNFVSTFTESMKNIQYVDPDANYDMFCLYNKANDSRKATSVFIVNLMKENIIDIATLINIISDTYNILISYINEQNRTNEVEEVIENLYLLITESIKPTKDNSIFLNDTFIQIIDNIKMVSKYKVKDVPSISSRAIFKLMDILDKVNK